MSFELSKGEETLSVRLDFEQQRKPIHFAIGDIDGKPYVGQPIPATITNQTQAHIQKNVPVLIVFDHATKKRDAVLADDSVLESTGVVLAFKPILLTENRWALEDIKEFLQEHDNTCNPDPIDLLSSLVDTWRWHLEFPTEGEYLYESLWDAATYFQSIFDTFPYVYYSGVKRCGKTKALTVHSAIAFNAIFTNNMSVASIFRLVQNGRVTLLLDESEKLSSPDRAQEFRSLLLSGYKRGAVVYRVEKDSKEKLVPTAFEVYSPKCLANIGGIESVLEDRCRVVVLQRSRNRAIVDKDVNLRSPLWPKLRASLYRLFLEYFQEVRQIHENLNELSEKEELISHLAKVADRDVTDFESLTARQLELWRAIFTMAIFFDSHSSADGEYLKAMIELAIQDSKSKMIEDVTESSDMVLAETLLQMVSALDWVDEYVPIKVVTAHMIGRYEDSQNWLNTSWVGRALKRLGFTDKRRLATQREIRLSRKEVVELARRLGIGDAYDASDGCDATEREGNKEKRGESSQVTSANVSSKGVTSVASVTSVTIAEKLELAKAWLAERGNLDDEGFASRLVLMERFGSETVRVLERDGAFFSHATKPNRVRLVRGGR